MTDQTDTRDFTLRRVRITKFDKTLHFEYQHVGAGGLLDTKTKEAPIVDVGTGKYYLERATKVTVAKTSKGI